MSEIKKTENNIKDFELLKNKIKEDLILKVNSIDEFITSDNEILSYINEEKNLIKQRYKENKRANIFENSVFLSILLIVFLFSFYIFDNRSEQALVSDKGSAIFLLFFCNFMVLVIAFCLLHQRKLSQKNEKSSLFSIKSRDLYVNYFKKNINMFLPLSKEELKNIYNNNDVINPLNDFFIKENDLIKKYIDENKNQIFTRYSLNLEFGITDNNLHMINEFKDIIDNNNMLSSFSEEQKIIAEEIIKKEQSI